VPEYTLCGTAFDGEDGMELLSFAEAGELVTCPDCRRVIDACRALKRYRLPPSDSRCRKCDGDPAYCGHGA
jgi:hypothetical protein